MSDIQKVMMHDIYNRDEKPSIAEIKQVLDTLKDKVQPLTPMQLQCIGLLRHLQERSLHSNKKVYEPLIKQIRDDAPLVAPPGFFIRVIEALVPRTQHIDGDAAKTIKAEKDGNR